MLEKMFNVFIFIFIMFSLLFLKIIFFRKMKYAMQNEINVTYLCIIFFIIKIKECDA